jgi:ankyrin repeat protein
MRGDYNYVNNNINNVSTAIINSGIRSTVMSSPRNYKLIIVSILKSNKVTEDTIDDIANIVICKKDLEALEVINNNIKIYFNPKSLLICFNNIEDKKNPDTTSIRLLQVLIKNSVINNAIKYLAQQACIYGYEDIVDTLISRFVHNEYYVFASDNENKKNCAYTAYENKHLNIVRKLVNVHFEFLAEVLTIVNTVDDLKELINVITTSSQLYEYIFMFVPMPLFITLYKNNPSAMRLNMPYIYKYIFFDRNNFRQKVNFMLHCDRYIINTPEHQELLKNTVKNFINHRNNQTGILIVSRIMSEIIDIDVIELFEMACRSQILVNIAKVFTYIVNDPPLLHGANMQDILNYACRTKSIVTIRFLLERSRELNFRLNIVEALQVTCGKLTKWYPSEQTIECIELLLSYHQLPERLPDEPFDPMVRLLNNLVEYSKNTEVTEYLFSKGATNMRYLYKKRIITDTKNLDLEFNILNNVMQKSPDKQIHLSDIHLFRIEEYIYNRKKLKKLIEKGIAFNRADMAKMESFIKQNERQIITTQLAIRAENERLPIELQIPIELQQYITDFIKLPGALEQ